MIKEFVTIIIYIKKGKNKMSDNIRKFFSDNLDKILTWAFASLTTGATSTWIAKLLEKKVYEKLSVGHLVIIGIIIITIIYFISLILKNRKRDAIKEYSKILQNVETILELKNWDNFIYGAQYSKYDFRICDQVDDIKKYKEENSIFWTNKDKKLKQLILTTIDSFIEMYKIITQHTNLSPDSKILYVDKFYQSYYGKPEEQQKMAEYDEFIKNSWNKIKDYAINLNLIVKYLHEKKYPIENTRWNSLFLV